MSSSESSADKASRASTSKHGWRRSAVIWIPYTAIGVVIEWLTGALRQAAAALKSDINLDLSFARDPFPDRAFHYTRTDIAPALLCLLIILCAWFALKRMEEAATLRVAAFSFLSALVISAFIW